MYFLIHVQVPQHPRSSRTRVSNECEEHVRATMRNSGISLSRAEFYQNYSVRFLETKIKNKLLVPDDKENDKSCWKPTRDCLLSFEMHNTTASRNICLALRICLVLFPKGWWCTRLEFLDPLNTGKVKWDHLRQPTARRPPCKSFPQILQDWLCHGQPTLAGTKCLRFAPASFFGMSSTTTGVIPQRISYTALSTY